MMLTHDDLILLDSLLAGCINTGMYDETIELIELIGVENYDAPI